MAHLKDTYLSKWDAHQVSKDRWLHDNWHVGRHATISFHNSAAYYYGNKGYIGRIGIQMKAHKVTGYGWNIDSDEDTGKSNHRCP